MKKTLARWSFKKSNILTIFSKTNCYLYIFVVGRVEHLYFEELRDGVTYLLSEGKGDMWWILGI